MFDHQPSALERRGAALADLLGGRWVTGQAMCRCPVHDDRTPSLSIRLGRSALLFKCFAGCERTDILRAIGTLEPSTLCRHSVRQALPSRVGREPDLGRSACRLWASARPLAASRAAAYLEGRAIDLRPAALRFHPRVPLGAGAGRSWRPAMLAAIEQRGVVVAVQRTFLDRDCLRLADDLAAPRRMLGRPLGGAVVLAPAGRCLGLAEGIETALAAMMLLGIPVWATLSGERFGHVEIPDSVERLILLPDNDRAGALADIRGREAHARAGRFIETLWPPAHLNDWNDLLRTGGKGAGEGGGSVD